MTALQMLIVDDEHCAQLKLRTFLEPLGQCDLAENGIEALENIFKSIDNKQPYDLIFLDIKMPGMDGQTILRKIRKAEAKGGSSPAKIVMTTSKYDPATVLQSFINQCEAFIVKPFTCAQVFCELRKIGFDIKEGEIPTNER